MQLQNANLGFMTEDEAKKTMSKNVEAQSLFNFEGDLDNEHILQIRDECLVHVTPDRLFILSGFCFSSQIKFQILPVTEPHGDQSFVGCLRFQLSQNVVNFFSKNVVELEQFVRVMEKKSIVQRGFHGKFTAIRKLKAGATARVFKCYRNRDKKNVAVKAFNTQVYFGTNYGRESFKKELLILSRLKNKHFSRYQGVFQTQNSTYVVLEMLAVSLLEYLDRYGHPNLEKVSHIMYQLLKGVQYLHKMGIMHRDLKLQNVMIRHDSPNIKKLEVVIVDFGLAEYINSEKFLFTKCGTPGYVAPEILNMNSESQDHYTQACDVFSLGCIFHILLTGKPLFIGSVAKEVIKLNSLCKIDFQNSIYEHLNESLKKLLFGMLEADPQKRINLEEALKYDFFQKMSKQDVSKIETSEKLQTTISE